MEDYTAMKILVQKLNTQWHEEMLRMSTERTQNPKRWVCQGLHFLMCLHFVNKETDPLKS